jgi:hypothetical protein
LSYEVILSYNEGDQNILEDAPKALVGAIDQAVKAPAVTAKVAPLGILQAYRRSGGRPRCARNSGASPRW